MSQLLQYFILDSMDRELMIQLIFRLVIHFLFLYIVIEHIYYRYNKKYKFILSFYMVSLLIFFITSFLTSSNIQTGFAFGLFAVFSIIRYRTDSIRIKDMTYLFVFIIMAVINSLITEQLSLILILFANAVMIVATFLLERRWATANLTSISVDVEDIILVHTENRDKLQALLEERTGLSIVSVEISSIDYLRDTFTVKVYFKGSDQFA
ncbi:MAG: DUF4956 domain-containing protein [Spirochaetales bacterium]|nr:DUF4956 domain-containing protein [Spirochaetales bacterium]